MHLEGSSNENLLNELFQFYTKNWAFYRRLGVLVPETVVLLAFFWFKSGCSIGSWMSY